MAAIEALDLRKSFGELQAVDGLTLRVEPGSIYALVGADGAGKTTAMRLLCGALRADAGEITLGGIDLRRAPERARAQLGYLPQRFSLYGEMTVLENLRFFAEVRGLAREAWEPRCLSTLAFVGLDEFAGRRAEALSGGMRQKLGLAAALVHRPTILLLDEPTGGVDPVTRQSFWQLLIELLGQGVAVLLTTPYMDEAARCSRVGFLQHGRLLVEGPPAAIAAPLEGRVLELVAQPRRDAARLAREDERVQDVQAFGDRLHVRVEAGAAAAVAERLRARADQAGLRAVSVRPLAPGLEDAFLALLQADLAEGRR